MPCLSNLVYLEVNMDPHCRQNCGMGRGTFSVGGSWPNVLLGKLFFSLRTDYLTNKWFLHDLEEARKTSAELQMSMCLKYAQCKHKLSLFNL